MHKKYDNEIHINLCSTVGVLVMHKKYDNEIHINLCSYNHTMCFYHRYIHNFPSKQSLISNDLLHYSQVLAIILL